MEYRRLGRTDMEVSAISFGAWAIGGAWGPVDDAESLRALVPPGKSLALRWILMAEAVTCAIPGARTPAQARDNAGAAELPPLPDAAMAAVRAVYDERIRPLVHDRW